MQTRRLFQKLVSASHWLKLAWKRNMDHRSPNFFQALFTNDIYYGWQWMGQQWERSLFYQFQLLGSYWEVHWLKLTPGLNRVLGGKTTPPNIFFRPILPKFEEIFEIVVGDFERWPMLPVRKTVMTTRAPAVLINNADKLPRWFFHNVGTKTFTNSCKN